MAARKTHRPYKSAPAELDTTPEGLLTAAHAEIDALYRELRFRELQLHWAEAGLKLVKALEAKFNSSGLAAGDWHVGREAVQRAVRTIDDLNLMRRHKENVLAEDFELHGKPKRLAS